MCALRYVCTCNTSEEPACHTFPLKLVSEAFKRGCACSQKGNAAEGTRGLAAGSALWPRVLWQGWKCVAWWARPVPSEINAGLERGPAGSDSLFSSKGKVRSLAGISQGVLQISSVLFNERLDAANLMQQ